MVRDIFDGRSQNLTGSEQQQQLGLIQPEASPTEQALRSDAFAASGGGGGGTGSAGAPSDTGNLLPQTTAPQYFYQPGAQPALYNGQTIESPTTPPNYPGQSQFGQTQYYPTDSSQSRNTSQQGQPGSVAADVVSQQGTVTTDAQLQQPTSVQVNSQFPGLFGAAELGFGGMLGVAGAKAAIAGARRYVTPERLQGWQSHLPDNIPQIPWLRERASDGTDHVQPPVDVAQLSMRDGSADNHDWEAFYDGPRALFPPNEVDSREDMQPTSTAGDTKKGVWRREAVDSSGTVHGYVVGETYKAAKGGRAYDPIWYTGVDREFQSSGVGTKMVGDALHTVLSRSDNPIAIAEIEHTGINTNAIDQFPSADALRQAANGGKATDLPSGWAKDPTVKAADMEAGPNAGDMTGQGQRLSRASFWVRQDAEAAPVVIKRTWVMPDLNAPDDRAADSAAHLVVWSKDGQLSREDAYNAMLKFYKKGYGLEDDHPLV
ncbi:MAG TPA: hypothetical protein V6C72_02240, partial [Chroococcales cyanobacterium]